MLAADIARAGRCVITWRLGDISMLHDYWRRMFAIALAGQCRLLDDIFRYRPQRGRHIVFRLIE